jgi:5-methylcytosine-specific restriction endonuclease McrA
MKRKRRTGLQRTKIFDAHGGICCLCEFKIDAPKQKWILEHKKPLWLGGADDESNLAPAHYDCAIEKTRAEAPVKAKSDRIRARHIGIRKRRRTIPGRRFNGDPIPAEWRD